MGAASDGDGGFGDFEMFSEEFDEGGISLAVMGFGAEVDSEFAGVCFDDFFPRGAGLDGDLVFTHGFIITEFG